MSDPGDLVAAMLVKSNHRYMYQTNMYFKMNVEFLATMIPSLLDGLAIGALEQELDRQQRLHALMYGPTTPLVFTNEGVPLQ